MGQANNLPYINNVTMNRIRKEALKRTSTWWYCDNIIDHKGQVGLLKMDFPQVFILFRDYDTAYWASWEEWKADIAEINFFNPADRETADLDEILTDAWNFLTLEEEAEEEQAQEYMDDEELGL